MPRALPWATDGAVKMGKTAVKYTKPTSRREPVFNSDEDLVNSDLDAIHPKVPERNKSEKKRARASSSSPPPPGPPPVEMLKPGFAADDIFMMVEDEFYSTAQLYTGHIHHAEYARLRKLHRSRGQETLAGLERGTDGKTEQSKALRMKMESLELAKKQKQTVRKLKGDPVDDSEAEDEYMQDPHLSGLMRESQMVPVQDLTGLVKTKANTRAAAGYSQSPYKAERTRDVFAEEQQQRKRRRMSKVGEDEDEWDDNGSPQGRRGRSKASITPATKENSETDSDDLDAGIPSDPVKNAISAWADKVVPPASIPQAAAIAGMKPSDSRPFSRFARPAEKPSFTKVARQPSGSRSPKQEARTEKVKAPETREVLPSPRSKQPVVRSTPSGERKYTSTLARKKAERAAAEEQLKTTKKEDFDEIPTFMF